MAKSLIAPFIVLLLLSCSQKRTVTSGRITYSIDYPAQKDNFITYSMLPKKLCVDFCDGLVKSSIRKAELVNEIYVDCSRKHMSAFFRFGNDRMCVRMKPADIKTMLAVQAAYVIKFTTETDTIAGFNVRKAIATAKSNASDVIELWYTEEIALANSNWYNPFKAVPGVLLQYAIDRYGMRMVFRATGFEEKQIDKNALILHSKGNERTYSNYNSELAELFKAFE